MQAAHAGSLKKLGVCSPLLKTASSRSVTYAVPTSVGLLTLNKGAMGLQLYDLLDHRY